MGKATGQYRQYSLTISTNGSGGTRVSVQEWDLPGSRYPERVAEVQLRGVAFPSHRDALEALRLALDLLEREC